ncbi:hypothetical protein C3E77_06625 [Mycetocola zhujimingii]|nr:hypothetical protein C3E77_06625 [Mycetocola zhujimingii]
MSAMTTPENAEQSPERNNESVTEDGHGSDAVSDIEAERAAAPCPVCGHPMSEHVIDHSTSNPILICPAPIDHNRIPETTSPLDELGMERHPAPPPAHKD